MLKDRNGRVLGTVVELDDGDVLLTRKEAAAYLKKSYSTLELWTRLGIGPPSVKSGRSRLYTLRALREHVNAGRQA
jgi:hypothetical protein